VPGGLNRASDLTGADAGQAPVLKQPFDLQGHRGARGLAPENTFAGFRAALAAGVDAIEIDVAVTADGVPVVSHDPLLNPDLTRDGRGNWLTVPGPPIRSLTLAQLATYDVGRIRPGTRYAALFPDQVPEDGARIPTLEATLRAFPGARFTIELKTFPDRPDVTVPPAEMAERVAAVLESVDAVGRVLVESFDWRGLRVLRRSHPTVALAYLTEPGTIARADLWWGKPGLASPGGMTALEAVASEGGRVWVPQHATLTEAEVAAAHGLGIAVLPWTVNVRQDMERLIGWGVDGIITDRPDHARAVMCAAGLTSPETGGAV
jgi:glycerophosphoryl diester phosphodiesterase